MTPIQPPATLTPAEELRAAAVKLREMAKSATPGPWATADCELYPRWIISEGATEGESSYAAEVAKSYHDDDGLAISDADWQWMAFASPVLAEPLAAWLEETARTAGDHQQMADYAGLPHHRWCYGCQDDECDGLANLDKALTVARAINGGAQ